MSSKLKESIQSRAFRQLAEVDTAKTEGSAMSAESRTLREALQRHGVEVDAQQEDLLAKYCELLWRANQHLNLTRHTTLDKFVGRDVVDSMWLARSIGEPRGVLDVGTGGGVPGIILSILRPDLDVELCESVRKKAAAVDGIVRQLSLPIPVHHTRAEELLEDFRYDVLTGRAIGTLSKILTWVKPHWASVGSLVLLKGPRWVEERREARSRGLLKGLELRRLVTYQTEFAAQAVILRVQAEHD
jgi:16S rRNA (guanine527-N7)-methyltransferase